MMGRGEVGRMISIINLLRVLRLTHKVVGIDGEEGECAYSSITLTQIRPIPCSIYDHILIRRLYSLTCLI